MFGPLSERIGRKIPIMGEYSAKKRKKLHSQSADLYQVGILGFASFSLPIAMAQNFYTILICRFLSGTFGAASSKWNRR